MTYDERKPADPIDRGDRDGTSMWAWVVGIALALLLGWALFSVFNTDGENVYDEAVPASGMEQPAVPNVNPEVSPMDAEPRSPDATIPPLSPAEPPVP